MDLAWTHSSLLDDKKWVRVLLHILDLSICIGVMLVKQHSIIDVATGILLALIIDLVITKKFNNMMDLFDWQAAGTDLSVLMFLHRHCFGDLVF